MLSTIMSFISGLLGKLFGSMLFGKKEPTVAEIAEAVGATKERLAVQEKANEVISTAAAARSDAELRVVQSVTDVAGKLDPSTANDKLAEQFPGYFRD